MHTALKGLHHYANKDIECCYDALALIYWHQRCLKIGNQLEEDLKVFRKFHETIIKSLKAILLEAPEGKPKRWAFTDENVKEILNRVHQFVCVYSSKHDYIDGRHDACRAITVRYPSFTGSKICYKVPRKSTKPAHPLVHTRRRLSVTQRRPFYRLVNDAAHIAKHGEKGGVRHKYKDYLEDKIVYDTLIPGLKVHEAASNMHYGSVHKFSGTKIFKGRFMPDYEGLKLKGNLSEDQKKIWADFGFSKSAIKQYFLEMEKLEKRSETRETIESTMSVKTESYKSQLGTALGIGGLTQVGTKGSNILQEVVKNGASTLTETLSSAGVMGGASVLVDIGEAWLESKNKRNEVKALREELENGIGEADFERLMTALRTILKDGKAFEDMVNEVLKLVRYHQEFKEVITKPMGPMKSRGEDIMTCGRAFEMVYRIMKFSKHYQELQQVFPVFKLFAKIAISFDEYNKFVKSEKLENTIESHVASWLKSGDHSACRKNNRCCCYSGTDISDSGNTLSEMREVTQESSGLGFNVSDREYEKRLKEIMSGTYVHK